jgi:BirA family biotin operon repressor/biotin-[acetyl-CoA-carboxylase] ligase
LEIIYFKELESTQKYLLENLKSNICIWTEYQTNGIGSRGNSWIGEQGNLFFSFSIQKENIPDDLPMQSISIYYMYLLKKLLNQFGSKVKFKWPNDLYLKNKVGGIISNIKNDIIIIGIGLNTKQSKTFQALDINVSNKEILYKYLEIINKYSWNEIFEEYKYEFYENRFISSEFDLGKAVLNNDGSIEINGERIYSLR